MSAITVITPPSHSPCSGGQTDTVRLLGQDQKQDGPYSSTDDPKILWVSHQICSLPYTFQLDFINVFSICLL